VIVTGKSGLWDRVWLIGSGGCTVGSVAIWTVDGGGGRPQVSVTSYYLCLI